MCTYQSKSCCLGNYSYSNFQMLQHKKIIKKYLNCSIHVIFDMFCISSKCFVCNSLKLNFFVQVVGIYTWCFICYLTLLTAQPPWYNRGDGGLHRGIRKVICPYHYNSINHESTWTSQNPSGKLELYSCKFRLVSVLNIILLNKFNKDWEPGIAYIYALFFITD